MQIKRILTILDRPNRPQMALKRAVRLAKDIDCAVVPISFLWNEMAQNRSMYDAKERRKMKHQLLGLRQEWLDTLAKQIPAAGDTQIVWEHDIERWVHDNQQAGDLVMKTSAGGGRDRSVLDWHILSQSRVPVWMVGHRKVRQPKAVLAAVDLGHKDLVHRRLNIRVLEMAANLAQASDAELHIAYAVEVPTPFTDLDIVNPSRTRAQVKRTTKPLLERLLKPYKVPAKRIHYPVGPIGSSIAETAKEIGAGVLVAGTCAHPVREAMGLGNSAQRILRKAPVDVVSVPPEDLD